MAKLFVYVIKIKYLLQVKNHLSFVYNNGIFPKFAQINIFIAI